LANISLELGNDTIVALMSEGVRLSIKGYADNINEGEPFKPLKELVTSFMGNQNGLLYVCKPCLVKRKISETELIESSKVVTGIDILKLVEDEYRIISL
jgi:predicted peroxiredoxin